MVPIGVPSLFSLVRNHQEEKISDEKLAPCQPKADNECDRLAMTSQGQGLISRHRLSVTVEYHQRDGGVVVMAISPVSKRLGFRSFPTDSSAPSCFPLPSVSSAWRGSRGNWGEFPARVRRAVVQSLRDRTAEHGVSPLILVANRAGRGTRTAGWSARRGRAAAAAANRADEAGAWDSGYGSRGVVTAARSLRLHRRPGRETPRRPGAAGRPCPRAG